MEWIHCVLLLREHESILQQVKSNHVIMEQHRGSMPLSPRPFNPMPRFEPIFSQWPGFHPRFHRFDELEPQQAVTISTSALEQHIRIGNSIIFSLVLLVTILDTLSPAESKYVSLMYINLGFVFLSVTLLLIMELPSVSLPRGMEQFVRSHLGFITIPFGRLIFVTYLTILLSALRGDHVRTYNVAVGLLMIFACVFEGVIDTFVYVKRRDYQDIPNEEAVPGSSSAVA